MKGTMPTFNVVIERDEEGWLVASVPALPGCHTQAKTQDELLRRIREAIQLHLDVHGAPDAPVEFIGVQRVEVSA
jgi:predicted RNase H-like HicB family nuclease